MRFRQPKSPEPVMLDYAGARGLNKLLRNLSGISARGRCLWTVSDEGRTVERLAKSAEGYRLAEQIRLDELLPDLPPGKESDLEAIAITRNRVWVCGSHCRVRRKPDPDGRLSAGFRRRPSRHVLAAVPLGPGREIYALPYLGEGSLRRRLRSDPFLSAFMNLPSKENGLDIEGLAVGADWLMVGLRGPVVDSFGIVMEFAIDSTGRVADSPPVRHILRLGGLGVRDLARWGDDILVLAGPVTAADGPFRLHLWRPAHTNEPQGAEVVHAWPLGHEHPEGICRLKREAREGLLVVYDSPDERRISESRYRADWFQAAEP